MNEKGICLLTFQLEPFYAAWRREGLLNGRKITHIIHLLRVILNLPPGVLSERGQGKRTGRKIIYIIHPSRVIPGADPGSQFSSLNISLL